MRIIKSKVRTFPCEGDPDGATVDFRHLSPGEVSDIIDAAVSNRVEYKKAKSGKMEPTFITDTNKRLDRERTAVKAIVGWTNFFGLDGVKLECTDDNKILALREIEGFAEFVTTCRGVLAMDIMKEQREQEGNSLSSAADG